MSLKGYRLNDKTVTINGGTTLNVTHELPFLVLRTSEVQGTRITKFETSGITIPRHESTQGVAHPVEPVPAMIYDYMQNGGSFNLEDLRKFSKKSMAIKNPTGAPVTYVLLIVEYTD